MNINNLKHIDMKTLKIIRLSARVLLWIVPVIVCSVWGLIFGSDNGRIGNIRLCLRSLFNR